MTETRGRVTRVHRQIPETEAYGEYIGVAKFSASGAARLRDYYRVEDAEGRRYWIYREGLFGDGRGGAPAWFLHGLFG